MGFGKNVKKKKNAREAKNTASRTMRPTDQRSGFVVFLLNSKRAVVYNNKPLGGT